MVLIAMEMGLHLLLSVQVESALRLQKLSNLESVHSQIIEILFTVFVIEQSYFIVTLYVVPTRPMWTPL